MEKKNRYMHKVHENRNVKYYVMEYEKEQLKPCLQQPLQ